MTKKICEAHNTSPGGTRHKCEMPAKWLVKMEGREAHLGGHLNVCGRHVRSYRGDIAAGWHGTITSLESQLPECVYCGRTVAKNHRLVERSVKGWANPFVGHLKCWREFRSPHNDPTRWDVKDGR